MFKPHFLCKRDKSMAMPSGDATQAGIFLVAYLYNFDESKIFQLIARWRSTHPVQYHYDDGERDVG